MRWFPWGNCRQEVGLKAMSLNYPRLNAICALNLGYQKSLLLKDGIGQLCQKDGRSFFNIRVE